MTQFTMTTEALNAHLSLDTHRWCGDQDDGFGHIITPTNEEGRPRIKDDGSELMLEIIPNRGEYARNLDRLDELENTFKSGIAGF